MNSHVSVALYIRTLAVFDLSLLSGCIILNLHHDNEVHITTQQGH